MTGVHSLLRKDLPKLECKTCHNKFHSACAHKSGSRRRKSRVKLKVPRAMSKN